MVSNTQAPTITNSSAALDTLILSLTRQLSYSDGYGTRLVLIKSEPTGKHQIKFAHPLDRDHHKDVMRNKIREYNERVPESERIVVNGNFREIPLDSTETGGHIILGGWSTFPNSIKLSSTSQEVTEALAGLACRFNSRTR
jgi:hypothetical protein